jgi:molybdopterin molybdotransferase
MQGHAALFRRTVRAVADEHIRTPGKLTHFLRAVLTETPDDCRVRLTGPQGSGILTSMARANALVVMPETRTDALPGETVTAVLLGETGRWAQQPPV